MLRYSRYGFDCTRDDFEHGAYIYSSTHCSCRTLSITANKTYAMPKLNALEKLDRLAAQRNKLVAGEDVAARDMRALLTDEQIAALDSDWQAQQELRKQTRARTDEEKAERGWKTKREVQIDVLNAAIEQAEDTVLEDLAKLEYEKKVRQARIFGDTFVAAMREGKTHEQALGSVNIALARAHLLSTKDRSTNKLGEHVREVERMEQRIKDMLRENMTEEERRLDDERREYEKKGE